MKLTIEHLAPYLPYKLKLNFVSDKMVDRLSNNDILELKEISEGYLCVNGYRTNNESYLPILRPAKDLSKDEYFKNVYILIGGGWKDYKTFKNAMLDNYLNTPIEVMSYRVVNLLLSMHFDVFGLIDQGLAIDINTLEP